MYTTSAHARCFYRNAKQLASCPPQPFTFAMPLPIRIRRPCAFCFLPCDGTCVDWPVGPRSPRPESLQKIAGPRDDKYSQKWYGSRNLNRGTDRDASPSIRKTNMSGVCIRAYSGAPCASRTRHLHYAKQTCPVYVSARITERPVLPERVIFYTQRRHACWPA